MRWFAVLCLVLMGCSQEPPPRRFESAAAAQVQTRTFQVGESRIQVLEIPVQSGRRVEFIRCIVLTNARGDSVMNCPGETSDVSVPPDVDIPSAADRH